MKLHLPLLQKLIDLPQGNDLKALRNLLDDVGLEVKAVTEAPHPIFTIETLANRGDHLSTLGVARELSARLLVPLKLPPVISELSDRKPSIVLRKNTDKCFKVSLLELNIKKDLTLRPEVKQILGDSQTGIPLVDLLNFIQLEIGQPMHAFDRDKIDGEMLIELTSKEETIEALNGKTYRVPKDSIIHRDRKKILDVGGVIGCANSMVTADTVSVLVEAAAFDPLFIRKTARAMGIFTEASHTFERGTDSANIEFALQRLVFLLQSAASSSPVTGYVVAENPQQPKRKITLRPARLKAQLNAPRLPDIEIQTRLKYLGYNFEAVEGSKELIATVPSWRLWDAINEEDLIEDFARSYSLSKITVKPPQLVPELPPENDIEILRGRFESALHGNGFTEVMSKGFYGEDDVQSLSSLWPEVSAKHIRLKNSLEKANSCLKVTNIIHLARLLEANNKRGVVSAKVYEVGRLFNSEPKKAALEFEQDYLTIAMSGIWTENEWGKAESLEERLLLFKGVIESIIRSTGQQLICGESNFPLLHPGLQATIKIGNHLIGVFGVIHPKLQSSLNIKSEVIYAELALDGLLKGLKDSSFELQSTFPSVRRDITLKVPAKQLAAKVVTVVNSLKLENLKNISAVDQFQRADETFRRLTYRLTFQNNLRTLEHKEVDADIEKVLATLKEKAGLELA